MITHIPVTDMFGLMKSLHGSDHHCAEVLKSWPPSPMDVATLLLAMPVLMKFLVACNRKLVAHEVWGLHAHVIITVLLTFYRLFS